MQIDNEDVRKYSKPQIFSILQKLSNKGTAPFPPPKDYVAPPLYSTTTPCCCEGCSDQPINDPNLDQPNPKEAGAIPEFYCSCCPPASETSSSYSPVASTSNSSCGPTASSISGGPTASTSSSGPTAVVPNCSFIQMPPSTNCPSAAVNSNYPPINCIQTVAKNSFILAAAPGNGFLAAAPTNGFHTPGPNSGCTVSVSWPDAATGPDWCPAGRLKQNHICKCQHWTEGTSSSIPDPGLGLRRNQQIFPK